ncbi:hypothetical protein TRQ7_01370 [Thermotoga sp. RQ7]|nr:hypothetical protein TRQ7_01370 [Thermotoga sp. RQ7]
MQMRKVLLEARNDFFFLLRRRNWKEKDLKVLKGIFLGRLSEVDVPVDIFELAVRKALKGDLSFASKILGVDEVDVLEILFWYSPKKFPLPSEKLKRMLKTKNVDEFIQKANSLRMKLGKRDFLDLYLHLEDVDEEEEESKETDILKHIEELSLEELNEEKVKELKSFYRVLPASERNRLRSLRVHPYVVASVVRKPVCPIVLDGSNLLWRGNLSVSYIYRIFEKLSIFEDFFFPYRIVFDRNAEFVLPVSERERFRRWKESPNVFFESPADRLIVSLAISMGAVVLSGDRFREYELSGKIRLITPEEIERG